MEAQEILVKADAHSGEKRVRADGDDEPSRLTAVKLDTGSSFAVPELSPELLPQLSVPEHHRQPAEQQPTVPRPASSAEAEDIFHPPAGPAIPRSEYQFVPKCGHRHPLKRSTGTAEGAGDDDTLWCNGSCGKEIRACDPRWSCYPCDYDLCELCMLSRCGGAAYIGLLAAEEARVAAARGEANTASERARIAERKLAAAEKAAEGKEKSAATERRAQEAKVAEAKVAAAEERATSAEAEVAKLQKEVVERRQRSKANLEKMYAAQKERDEARALVGANDAEQNTRLERQTGLAEEGQRQVAAARQQLACAFGDDEALSRMGSLDEVQSLQSALIGGLVRINERCAALEQKEQTARSERINCAVCMSEPRAVAYVPCGHVACCRGCAPKVDACPLCKRSVTQRVSIFLP